MELLTTDTSRRTIKLAKSLKGTYNNPVIFHCYWQGNLQYKHLVSIKSCYFFNVLNKSNRKIVLWLENNTHNEFNDEVKKYAEIKPFSLENEKRAGF